MKNKSIMVLAVMMIIAGGTRAQEFKVRKKHWATGNKYW